MTDESLPIPSERLTELHRRAQSAGLDEVATVINELLYWRRLFARLYHAILDEPGAENVHAELMRLTGRLGVVKPGKRDTH